MSSLDTLDGVEEGTDIALVTTHGVTRWTMRGGQLVNPDGGALDPWFFSGALAQGKVMLGHFAPPREGECFVRGNTDRIHLVVAVDRQTTAHCARYVNGSFLDFVTLPNVVDTHQRVDPPDWANPQLVQMAVRAYGWHRQTAMHAERARKFQGAQHQLRYARDYLNQAMESIQ